MAKITGTVIAEPQYDHETAGAVFYRTILATNRKSGYADEIPVIFRKGMVDENKIYYGANISVEGNFRSVNMPAGEKRKLILYLFAEQISDADATEILKRYLESYDQSDDQSQWFDKIRTIAEDMGYAAKPKDYKKHPEEYKGHVGHVSTVIRLAVAGRSQSPDIWEIQQILGEEKTRQRVEMLIG